MKKKEVQPLKVKVLSMKGSEVGDVELDAEVFGVKVQADLVHQVVRWQRAKARSGTHATLTKGMMKGGNRKPFKQKGSGRARAGSNTSPLWVGGGKSHGPQPRDYEFRLSKRTRRQALASVLTDKVNKSTLVILDELSLSKGRTKEMVKVLKALKIEGKKLAIVLPGKEDLVWRGAGNLKNVITLPVQGMNVYDLLKHQYLVSTKEGVQAIEKRVKAE
jgi:large subunit ribosomal protein L4